MVSTAPVLLFLASAAKAQPATNDVAAEAPLPHGAVARFEVQRVDGAARSVDGLAAAPDGSQIAVFDPMNNTVGIAILDGRTGRPDAAIERFGNFAVQQIAYSPTGRFAAAGTSQSGLLLWDTSNAADRVVLRAFNPGRYVAAASSTAQLGAEGELTGEIIVSPLVGARPGVIPHLSRWQAHTAAVTQMRFSPDGQRLASIGRDKTLAVWLPRSGKLLFQHVFERQPLNCLALTRDGAKVAAVVDGSLQVWDVETSQRQAAGEVAGDPVTAIEFTAGGKLIVVGDGAGVLRVYDAQQMKLQRETTAHRAAITSLLAAPGDDSIVSGGDDGVVHAWNVASLEKQRSFYPNRSPVVGLAFSKDSEHLGVATERFGGWCWKFSEPEKPLLTGVTTLRPLGVAFTETGDELITISDRRVLYRSPIKGRQTTPPGNVVAPNPSSPYWPAGFNGLVFSPDGKYVAAPLAEGIALWEVSTAVLRNVFPVERNIAHAVAISPDGRWMAAGGLGIALWDLHAEKLVATIPPNESDEVYSLAFSPNSRLLAAGGARECRVWNVGSRRMTSIVETGTVLLGNLGFTADGYSLVALSSPPPPESMPAGMRAIAASRAEKKRVAVWEIVSGELRYELEQHPAGPTSAFLASDGAALYTGSHEGTVYRWDLGTLLEEQEKPVAESAPVDQLWQNLASDDVTTAYRAIRALTDHKEAALAQLALSLQPVSAEAEDLDRRIAELGSPVAAVRREASERLRRAGSTAWPKLQETLAAAPTPAVRTRLEMLLAARIDAASNEQIRAVRAVQVLERMGGDAAKDILKRLAGGLAGASLTEAAQAALANSQSANK